MTRAESTYLMTAKARAHYAAELFSIATVAAVIDELASQGHRHYRIVQELPFDLSETVPAHKLETWLEREEFRYVWRPTVEPGDPQRPTRSNEYPELEIQW
jgi:hypothetical protein